MGGGQTQTTDMASAALLGFPGEDDDNKGVESENQDDRITARRARIAARVAAERRCVCVRKEVWLCVAKCVDPCDCGSVVCTRLCACVSEFPASL